MHVTSLDAITVSLNTAVVSVGAEGDVVTIAVELDGNVQLLVTAHQPNPGIVPPEQWQTDVVGAKGVRVVRNVRLGAIPARDIIGAGRIIVDSIQMAQDLFLVVE